MPRRSPWAKMPKKNHRPDQRAGEVKRRRNPPSGSRQELWRKYDKAALTPAAREAYELRDGDLSGMSNESKRRFLLKNRNETVKALHEGTEIGVKEIQRALETFIEKIKPESLQKLVRRTAQIIIIREANGHNERMERVVENYLKDRGIPVEGKRDKETIGYAIFGVYNRIVPRMNEGIQLRKIEREYLDIKKSDRYSDQSKAMHYNTQIEEIFSGIQLTSNQRKAAKKWLEQHRGELEKAQRQGRPLRGGISKEGGMKEYLAHLDRVNNEFLVRARSELLKQFQPRKRAESIKATGSPKQAFKSGTRDQRLAGYVPAEKRKAERVKTVEQIMQIKREVGPFDATDEILNEIEADSGTEKATKFRVLIQEKILNEDSLKRMYIAGSLTQRIFLEIIQNPDFKKRYGPESANRVARGLSFIGPKGKPIVRAQKVFQFPKGKEMFDFLANHGFLETHHGGGKVVYLRR